MKSFKGSHSTIQGFWRMLFSKLLLPELSSLSNEQWVLHLKFYIGYIIELNKNTFIPRNYFIKRIKINIPLTRYLFSRWLMYLKFIFNYSLPWVNVIDDWQWLNPSSWLKWMGWNMLVLKIAGMKTNQNQNRCISFVYLMKIEKKWYAAIYTIKNCDLK